MCIGIFCFAGQIFAINCVGWSFRNQTCSDSDTPNIFMHTIGASCPNTGNILTKKRKFIATCETIRVAVYFDKFLTPIPFPYDTNHHDTKWVISATNHTTQIKTILYSQFDDSITTNNYLEFVMPNLPSGNYTLDLTIESWPNGQHYPAGDEHIIFNNYFIFNTTNFNLNFTLATYSQTADCYASGFCATAEYPNEVLELMTWKLDGDDYCNQYQCDHPFCQSSIDSGMHTVTLDFNFHCCSLQTTISKSFYKGSINALINVANNCGNSTLTASASPAGDYSYQWTLNGNPISGATASTYQATQNGNYSVIVANPGICSDTAYSTVNIYANCCNGEAYLTYCNGLKFVNLTYGDVNLSTIYSDLCGNSNIITTNRKIAVNGVLTVDGNYTISNTPNFTFGKYASVIIPANKQLTISNSTLKACGDTMWQGITLANNTATLKVYANSLIADAQTAISIQNNAAVELDNSRFFRNNVSVSMENSNSPNLIIKGCTFKYNPGDSLANYMLYPYLGKRPDVGIVLSICDKTAVGGAFASDSTNIFDGLNCGIFGAYSGFTVNKNKFFNIKNYNNLNLYNGTAVYGFYWYMGTTTPDSASIKTVVGPVTASTPATFANCDTAVFMYGMSLNMDNNKLDNVNTGIYCVNATNQNIFIKNNRINQTRYGITLNNTPGSRNRIQNNYIQVTDPSALLPNTYGIVQQEASNATASNTQIFQDTVMSGRYCVMLNTCNNTTVYECNLFQWQGQTAAGTNACVYATNCKNIFINNNNLKGNVAEYEGSTPTYSRKRKSGVEFFNSVGVVCSNTANTIGYGFNFIAGCNSTNLRNNTINDVKYGVTLNKSGTVEGVIGQQGDYYSPAGNNFQGPFNNRPPYNNTDSAYRTFTFSSKGYNSNFYRVQPTDYPYPNGSDVLNQQITTPSCGSNTTNYICTTGTYNKNGVGTNSTGQYENDIANSKYGNGSNELWLMQKNLFDQLDADYNLRTSNPVLENFYTASAAYATLRDIENKIADAQRNHTKDTVYAKQQLADAINLNNRLNTAIPQEANHQIFNELYLKSIEKGFKGFAPKEAAWLLNLAAQCPYTEGDAVYRARTLYAQIDNSIYFYNDSLCNTISKPAYKKESESLKTENQPFTARFAPNPANGYTSLLYQIEENTTAILVLTNQLGQYALEMKIGGNQNRADIPIADLMQGIYFYKVTNNKGECISGKLDIFK
ncbi:MAG: T9SS type A sorting domain-containing protein [Chitinophagales bacterium]|nr:T9SS type A sorting domain-containing protein [Chitinophagales bacterium]